LLFDLGHTLWYRDNQENWDKQEHASNQCAIELLRQHVDSAQLSELDDQTLGLRLRQDFDHLIHTTIHNEPLLEPDAEAILVRVLEDWGVQGVDRSLGHQLFEALRVRVPVSRPLFPDALSTLAELKRRGYLLGIVTNRLWGGPPFYEDLETIGLLEYFDAEHIAISGDLGIRKPNPQIFLQPLNALQVAPQEAAMIGDSLSADILGAQPLGIYAIWRPKAWLCEWALEHTRRQARESEFRMRPLSVETFPGIDTADSQTPWRSEPTGVSPEEMLASDDDYILARANMSRDYLERFRRGEIRPDNIISTLADLLEIFPGVDRL
jgi:HAD superfamily hydrolase (TIGR01509 family)